MIKIYDMETLEEREILFRGGSGADGSSGPYRSGGTRPCGSITSALTAQRRTPWR